LKNRIDQHIRTNRHFTLDEIHDKFPQISRSVNTGTWSSRLEVGRRADGPCSVNKLLLRNPKKWIPDSIWQNLLRKAIAKKGLFCQLLLLLYLTPCHYDILCVSQGKTLPLRRII
jgi:hypothetical protein